MLMTHHYPGYIFFCLTWRLLTGVHGSTNDSRRVKIRFIENGTLTGSQNLRGIITNTVIPLSRVCHTLKYGIPFFKKHLSGLRVNP
jgi:hypothetical protein